MVGLVHVPPTTEGLYPSGKFEEKMGQDRITQKTNYPRLDSGKIVHIVQNHGILLSE